MKCGHQRLAIGVLTLTVVGRLSPTRSPTVEPPVLLGLYTSHSLQATSGEVAEVDEWLAPSRRSISLAGTFMDLEWPNPGYNVPAELEAAWSRGYVPFVNLTIGTIADPEIVSALPESSGYPRNRTAAFVAQSPSLEPALQAWARAFAAWSAGGEKKAFIAPLQEMNGGWTSYGIDPDGFRRAYLRLREALERAGVADGAVSWVFAPNGWSDIAQGHPPFEAYYPGDGLVEVVALSAYNYGTCVWQWPRWETFDQLFLPYLSRMRAMAPSKPIFIAQTATVDQGGEKNVWLDDSYTRLAAYPAVRAVMYFHKRKAAGLPCDPVEWRFYAPANGIVYPGILEALSRAENGFGAWKAQASEWGTIAFAEGPGGNRFEDVERSHPFAGVPDVWYFRWVEALGAAGIVEGCGTDGLSGRLRYCPLRNVTRAEMAVYLLRGRHGPAYRPPEPDGSAPFADLAGHWARGWVEALFDEGLSKGYPDGSYRPDASVSRGEAAVLGLRAKHDRLYSPPPPGTITFTDISGHWAVAWIEALRSEGLASGFPDGSFRPETAITRAEMAALLAQAFSLSPP